MNWTAVQSWEDWGSQGFIMSWMIHITFSRITGCSSGQSWWPSMEHKVEPCMGCFEQRSGEGGAGMEPGLGQWGRGAFCKKRLSLRSFEVTKLIKRNAAGRAGMCLCVICVMADALTHTARGLGILPRLTSSLQFCSVSHWGYSAVLTLLRHINSRFPEPGLW
jgi:hypothetical protein